MAAAGFLSGPGSFAEKRVDAVDLGAPGAASLYVQRVEHRALMTSFARLDDFGRAAVQRNDAEGLSRLQHVIWIVINQGEFDEAARWNDALRTAADRQGDARYRAVVQINALRIRHLRNHDVSVAALQQLVEAQTDWLPRVFAEITLARRLFDDNQIGTALKLMAHSIARIPDGQSTEASAVAAAWDVVGIAHIMVDDVQGFLKAAERAEALIAKSPYPRPDYETIYNLTQSLSYLGRHTEAKRMAETYARLAGRTGTPTALGYAGNICAFAAASRDDWHGVLRCLAPFGSDLTAPAVVRRSMLPFRATAYARTGQPSLAQRDIETITRSINGKKPTLGMRRAEAELLIAQGDYARGISALRSFYRDRFALSTQSSAKAMEHVVDDIDDRLEEERNQSRLKNDVISKQRYFVMLLALLGSVLVALAVILSRQRGRYLAQSITDPLTGLPNRRHTKARGEEIVMRAVSRHGRAFLAIIDLDHFKSCNDRFGHDAGDEALKTFADLVRKTVRPGDVFGRWGGEEFLLIVPNAGIDEARALLRRMAEVAAAAKLRLAPDYPLLFSGGVVAIPSSAQSLEQALVLADERLYAAKKAGRNRAHFDDGEHVPDEAADR